MYTVKCFFVLMRADLKSRMIYKLSPFLYIFGLILLYISAFLGNYIMLTKFKNIDGWEYGQIIFIYVFCLVSYGVRSIFFNHFTNLGGMILDGSLDNILIKPMNSFVYLVGSHFEIGGFSHIIAGGIIFFKFNHLFGVTWNVKNIIFYIIAIICASLVQSSITVIIGSCAFFVEQNEGLRRLYEGFRQFIYYPVTLYNKYIQVVLFCILPLAFATFIPAAVFLNHPVYNIMSKTSWLLFLVGITGLLSVIAVGVFNFGLSHYKSSGT